MLYWDFRLSNQYKTLDNLTRKITMPISKKNIQLTRFTQLATRGNFHYNPQKIQHSKFKSTYIEELFQLQILEVKYSTLHKAKILKTKVYL